MALIAWLDKSKPVNNFFEHLTDSLIPKCHNLSQEKQIIYWINLKKYFPLNNCLLRQHQRIVS